MLVRAVVRAVLQELVDQISIGRMSLDTVEAGALRVLRSTAEVLYEFWVFRRSQAREAGCAASWDPVGGPARGMRRLSDLLPPGDLLVVPDARTCGYSFTHGRQQTAHDARGQTGRRNRNTCGRAIELVILLHETNRPRCGRPTVQTQLVLLQEAGESWAAIPSANSMQRRRAGEKS